MSKPFAGDDKRAAPGLVCPVPAAPADAVITLAHGEGGRETRKLLEEVILPRLGWSPGLVLEDAAVLAPLAGPPVLTTDAFVVQPWKFPGGDIGSLAIFGAVNDLAVRGAEPVAITLALILEEGLPLAVLEKVLTSAAAAAQACGVRVVAGDTKVVPRGAADGLYLMSTGLGVLVPPAPSGPATIVAGDRLLITGPPGRHGVAVLAAREGLGFEPPPESDCGSLLPALRALRAAGVVVRAARDATRGGVTAVLHEWARDCGQTLVLDEGALPQSEPVRGVCELLGLDPLALACEGTMLLAVPPSAAKAALAALREDGGMPLAAIVGEVRARDVVPVVVRRPLGREQPLFEPAGAPLPRIC